MMKFGLLVLVVIQVIGKGEAQRGGNCRTSNGGPGTCIALLNCQSLRDLLTRVRAGNAPVGSVDVLRRAICHFDNNEPLLCCPAETPTTRPPPPTTQTPRGGVLPERCGIQGLTDRIIDGTPAPLRAWPWMVILRGNSGGRSNWFCGGTLISDRYVLTAAHCFKPQLGNNLEFARIGEHNIAQDPDCEFEVCAPPPQDIPVESIIMHPSYGSPHPCSECNDIALLRLSRKAILHPLYVSPICLPRDPVTQMGFSVAEFQGKEAWAAGWGTTARNPREPRIPSVLQQVQLPIRVLPYCESRRRSYPNKNMVICAGGEGKDTCRGDSGGPLTLTNSENIRHFVVGVTSVGPLVCGAQDTQGLYTSVHHYLQWIIGNMRL